MQTLRADNKGKALLEKQKKVVVVSISAAEVNPVLTRFPLFYFRNSRKTLLWL